MRPSQRKGHPLRNRVDVFGALHAVVSRGLFTGNRGVLHDPETRRLTGRRWTTHAWIVCTLNWKGRRRDPMGRNGPKGAAGWTDLFFLDEVTALAAGHRPCFYCRREKALSFSACFAAGQDRTSMRAPEIDAILHRERRAAGAAPVLFDAADLPDLPEGAVVSLGGKPYALRGDALLGWSFEGWMVPVPIDSVARDAQLCLVTPRSTVSALKAGYRPVWAPGTGEAGPFLPTPA